MTVTYQQQIDALNEGIAKWDLLATDDELPAYRGAFDGSSCRLCALSATCDDCPVFFVTEAPQCSGIGWHAAKEAFIGDNLPGFLEAARTVREGLIRVRDVWIDQCKHP